MTAAELISLLEELDPDTEIRLMSQPSWPFEYSIEHRLYEPEPRTDACGYCGMPESTHTSDSDHDMEEPEDTFEPEGSPEHVAYLLEGTQLAYGTKSAWSY